MIEPASVSEPDEPDQPAKKAKVTEPRGRNATALAEKNAFDFDSRVTFSEEGHRYTVDGVAVRRSATGLIKEAFLEDEFDGRAIASNNLANWRAGRGQAKYQDAIYGLDDDAAIAAVCVMWERDTVYGTLAHKYAEISYNGFLPDMAEFTDVEAEAKQFDAFRQLTDLTISRTELSLFYTNSSGVTICGQADFLFRDPDGKPVIIDLKRTHHDLSPGARAGSAKLKFPQTTTDNKFHRYSLQNSIYSVMYSHLTGEEVDVCHLLQVHAARVGFTQIECADLRAEARALLEGVR